jgi:hypothetical protein
MADQKTLPPSDIEQRLARIEDTLTKLAASGSAGASRKT